MQASAGSGADNFFCRRDVAELMIELSTKQSSRADFADDRKATNALVSARRRQTIAIREKESRRYVSRSLTAMACGPE